MTKNTFATLGILAVLLLSFGLTSAAYTTTNSNVTLTTYVNALTNVSADETYDFDAKVENMNGTDYYVVFGTTGWDWSNDEVNVSDGTSKDFTGTMTIPASGSTKSIIAKFYDASNNSEFLFQLTKSVSLTYYSNTTDNPVDTDPITTFCQLDNFGAETGHLEISEIEITNNGAGDDEEWEYLDEIIIEVTIENTHDDENINDVMVELLIQDDRGNTVTRKDINLDQDEENLGRINDDDEETATFTIDELPIDLEEGDYKLYIRAYEDGNEDNECVSESEDFTNADETYFEFEIKSSEDSTVIIKRDLPNVKASCGDDNVEVRFMVYNTGNDDEDTVLVTLENSKLGIYEKVVIDNLRDGKGKEAVFFISVPEEVEKTYEKLEIYTYYDYDDDEDEMDEHAYGESSEDEGDDFSMLLEILSCQAPQPTITANLESTAQVGENLIVKAIITNNGEDNDFIISATGFDSWANLVSINPQTTSINAGATQEILITLSPTQAGSQSFKVTTILDGETHEQAISLNIKEKEGFFGFIPGTNNILAYTIIGIVSLLVLIFLVLIVRISKRTQTAAQF